MRISDWSSDVCSSDLLLGEGAEGEILVRGPEVMLGYTDQALMDDAFDQDGFFRTGDLGRIEFGDFLAVSGRKKDVIVRGGENISPPEIEEARHRYTAGKRVGSGKRVAVGVDLGGRGVVKKK